MTQWKLGDSEALLQADRVLFNGMKCQIDKIGTSGAYKNKAKVILGNFEEKWVYLTQLKIADKELQPDQVIELKGFKIGDRIAEDLNNPTWGVKNDSLINQGEIIEFRPSFRGSSKKFPWVLWDNGTKTFAIWECISHDLDYHPPTIPSVGDTQRESQDAFQEVVEALTNPVSPQPHKEELKTDRDATSDIKWTTINQCSQQDTYSPAQAEIQKEPLQPDTSPCGQFNGSQTVKPNGQQESTESDSQKPDSSTKTLEPLQTSSFSPSRYQTCLSSVVLAPISPYLASVPGLKAIAANCFLKESDFFDSSSLKVSSLKTSKDYSVPAKGKTSSELSTNLLKWGMWGLGKLETETDTSLKTGNDSSVWVFTGDVRCTKALPYKKSLAECLTGQGMPVKGRPDKGLWQVNEAPALHSAEWANGLDVNRSPNGRGAGFAILDPVVIDSSHKAWEGKVRAYDKEAPCLLSPATGGSKLAVVYKAAEGDRIYKEDAPCVRSLTNTNGHQAGSGAVKVREIDGESYVERPMTATEYERVMGWEEDCTKFAFLPDGSEVEVSETQRKRAIGNGIIPKEVTEILTALKPFLVTVKKEELSKTEEDLTPVDESAIGKHFWCDRLTVAVEVLTVHKWREKLKSQNIIKGARCKPWWNKDKWGNNFPECLVIAFSELVEIEEFSKPNPNFHSLEQSEQLESLIIQKQTPEPGDLVQVNVTRSDGQDLKLPVLVSEDSIIASPPTSGLSISFGKTYPQLLKGKPVTRRRWKRSHAEKFIRLFEQGTKFVALDKDRRYGGKQVGWLTLTQKPYEEKLSDMPATDLALEGFPGLSLNEFIDRFFEGKPESVVWVIRFKFEPLEEVVVETKNFCSATLSKPFLEKVKNSPKPTTEIFLKWAGGKSWAVDLAKELYAPFRDYRLVSLTLGGGAIELGLQPERALLCDVNPYLINLWQWVHRGENFTISLESNQEYFLEIRDRFNADPLHPDAPQWFYLLNHTCYNGLQRGSSIKHFNVGWGKYKAFHGQTDLTHYASVMQGWEFKAQSWEQTLLEIKEDDFVIFDPPYHGKGFKEYYGRFTDTDQVAAAQSLANLSNPIVAFNAATPEMLELYQDLGFDVKVQEVARSISCNGDRTPALEMIATKNCKRDQGKSPTSKIRQRRKNKVQASGSLSKVGGKQLKNGSKTERWLYSYSEKVQDAWKTIKRHVPTDKVEQIKEAIANHKGHEYICQSILAQPLAPSN